MSDPRFVVQEAALPDTRLPYVECGAGDAIVLLHGALGDWRTWRDVLPRLAERGRAIAYTQRWFGSQPRDHGAASFGTDQQADDLLGFLDVLSIEAAHIVAWSFSAHSALVAALRAPERFKSLIVYDLGFPTFVDEARVLAEVSAATGPAFGRLAAMIAANDDLAAARLLVDLGGGEGCFDTAPPDQRDIWIDNAHTLAWLFRQTTPTPISARDLAGLRVPVTVAWGEKSGPYRLVSRAAARLIPQGREKEVSGSDHLYPQSAPHAFADLCLELLASHTK